MDQDSNEKHSMKDHWVLFTSMLSLSCFTFGGGFVIAPLMKKRFVEKLQWMSEEEMLNFFAIASSCPGPVAVNTAILVGYRVMGLMGAFISILATVIPPIVIMSLISVFYQAFQTSLVIRSVLKAMQAGVAAVIISVVFDMGRTVVKAKEYISIFTMIIVFVLVYFKLINFIYILIICGAIGLVRSFFTLSARNNL